MVERQLNHQHTSPIINVMYKSIMAASNQVLRDFGEVENLQISKKGPGNFVSQTDKRVESLIKAELQKARPEYGFIGEESGHEVGEDTQMTWVLDPIDGTNNFIHGLPHFCISLALVKKDQAIAGMIFDPIRDEVFFCERGAGAYSRNARLRVSGRSEMVDSLVTVAGPMRSSTTEPIDRIRKVGLRIPCVRISGSAALDLAYLAAGRMDLFWSEQLKPWDYMAGCLMVQEAGGYVCDFQRRSITMDSQSIVAGNTQLQEDFLELLTS